MDFDSRDQYRKVVGSLAKHSPKSEQQVAAAAVELAGEALARSDGSRWAIRRSNVGYYLLDRRDSTAAGADRGTFRPSASV